MCLKKSGKIGENSIKEIRNKKEQVNRQSIHTLVGYTCRTKNAYFRVICEHLRHFLNFCEDSLRLFPNFISDTYSRMQRRSMDRKLRSMDHNSQKTMAPAPSTPQPTKRKRMSLQPETNEDPEIDESIADKASTTETDKSERSANGNEGSIIDINHNVDVEKTVQSPSENFVIDGSIVDTNSS